MRGPILFIFSFLLLHSGLHAQQIRVLSSSDRRPIENVAVYTVSLKNSTISDSLGLVDLSIFRSGDTLHFQHPSFVGLAIPLSDLQGRSSMLMDRKNVLIDEFVISASKSREKKMTIPYAVEVLRDQDLAHDCGMTGAEILASTGTIMVQKSQGGGGSPVLRGFEANKILLVVDGVRLNNAIYRSGHLQNSITIDPSILERTEVIFGPSSIIYGSDALGGVVHYYTRDPECSKDEQPVYGMGASIQSSSASLGMNAHMDVSVGTEHWAFLSSASHKRFGDLRMGGRRDPTLGDWGKSMHFVTRINGRDSTVVNPNPLIQKNTSYHQTDLLQKIRYTPSPYVDWIINLQYSTSSDIDRLDMLNDYNGDNLKYAEYYYGPQNRFLGSLKNVLKKDNRLFTNMTTTLAFQRIDEDRVSRKFQVPESLFQEEDVFVYSLNSDLLKIWSKEHRLNYGLELNYNRVLSEAWYLDMISGDRTPAQTRYPDGGSYTWNTALYGSYKWIMGEKGVLNAGARYSYAGLSSAFLGNILPYDQVSIANGALTGSLGYIWSPNPKWQLKAILSSGFRNPNVDDFGKVRAKDDYITVPNENLSPEYSYNADLGISRTVEGYIRFELTAYYSYIKDAIVRTTHRINGMDSLMYDGDMYRVTANYNAAAGMIYGGSLRLTSRLNSNFSLNGTLNYTYGRNLSDDVPLGHIPPFFGRTVIRYEQERFFLDTYAIYQGWKYTEDFSPYGEDNDEEAMEYGYPAWWTLNLKAGFHLGERIDLMLALENLLDQFYKPWASGISAPGRNIILSARFKI